MTPTSPTPFYEAIGRNIRDLRRAACLSQGQIAAHMGVSFQQVQKYERGANRLPLEHLHTLKNLLDVPYDAFFTVASDKTTHASESEIAVPQDPYRKQTEQLIRRFQMIGDPVLRHKALTILSVLIE